MNKTMKDNISLLSEIIWYDIDKNGYINKSLKNQTAVYIYMKIRHFDSKACYYVGSTNQLASRISSHRSLVINWDKHKKKGSSIFYISIRKHGWLNFKFGILEYVDLSNLTDTEQKKKTLLEREQYYLDNINPSLNTRKIAYSPLGVKRDRMFSVNLSKSRRGKSIKSFIKDNIIPKVVSSETKLKISLRCQGVSVKVFDKSNNLVKQFPTITSAALHFGVSTRTLSMIYKTGKSYDDYIYKFKVKDIRVWIYDSNNKFIKILDNIIKTSLWSKIPESTLSNYIKSGKLYKNKYYFYNINSKSNPYFNK